MKIEANAVSILLVPEEKKDIELLEVLFVRLKKGASNYNNYELLENNILSFQTS